MSFGALMLLLLAVFGHGHDHDPSHFYKLIACAAVVQLLQTGHELEKWHREAKARRDERR